MARLPRYVLPPSGYYHVTTRGVDWTWIYRDDEDRRHFLRLLGIVVRRFGWNLDTFCLMGNHYHLIVDTDLESLSAGMEEPSTSAALGLHPFTEASLRSKRPSEYD